MAQYHSVNVNLSNSQLNKLKFATKKCKWGNSKIIIKTDRQVLSLHMALANNSLAHAKLSETQLSKIIQSGGFLARLLGLLMKVRFPLMKNA